LQVRPDPANPAQKNHFHQLCYDKARIKASRTKEAAMLLCQDFLDRLVALSQPGGKPLVLYCQVVLLRGDENKATHETAD
jgi:hypothetical protein